MVDTIHKTLIIRFSSVGDIVLSSLLLRVLRKRFPDSHIDFLTKPEYAALVRNNPHISRVIEFQGNGGMSELGTLRSALMRTGYDLVLDIHGSVRSRFVCAGFPLVRRVRKRKIARFLLVNAKWDVYEWYGGAPSIAERYLETAAEWGVVNDGEGLEVFFTEDDARHALTILGGEGIRADSTIVGLCPSARHNTKQWVKERFAETAAALAHSHNAAIVVFGSAGEEARCEEIRRGIRSLSAQPAVVNLAGKLSLAETAAMMDFCSLVITNDSGLMHLAAARKRKVLAIFGSTVRELGFFPYGTTSTVIERADLDCRPCTHIGRPRCPKGHFKCMMDITSAEVIAAADLLLRN